jgi:hypothetical protein
MREVEELDLKKKHVEKEPIKCCVLTMKTN